MNSGVIRRGTAADMPQIMVLRSSVAENHLSIEQLAGFGITQNTITAQLASGELACWVADQDGEICAFAMANRDTANIFALFTKPGHEGRGYGAALLTACLDWLRGLGHRQANLTTGPKTKSLQFYLRRGWRIAAEHGDEDSELVKDL